MAKKGDDTILSELSLEELRERIQDETKRLSQLKFNHVVTPMENPTVLKGIRRGIARLKTELNARSLNSAE